MFALAMREADMAATNTYLSRLSRPGPLRAWLTSLTAAFTVGVICMAIVLVRGLQVTGLSDRVPWGLWITLDLSAIALGAGAFTFSAAVYLFRIKPLEVLARPNIWRAGSGI